MPKVVFARPEWDYVPYHDLYRLIELSGYELVKFSEIDPDSDNTYIITIYNDETQHGYPGAHARLILLDLEWHNSKPEIPGVSEVWAADKWYADKIGARYTPLGSHPELNPHPAESARLQYDIAFMAYLDPHRRAHVVERIRRAGLSIAPNGWNEERHRALLASRCVLHVHQHDHIPAVAPLRWCIAAAYGLPIISEAVADRGLFTQSHFMTAEYRYLSQFAQLWLKDHASRLRLADYGRALHSLLCQEHTFKKSIEAVV